MSSPSWIRTDHSSPVRATTIDNINDQQVIQRTRRWLKQVVIDLDLCPFAARVYDQGNIRYHLTHDTDTESHLQLLDQILRELDQDAAVETCLIIFTDACLSFDDYLDMLYLANALIDEFGYSGRYQLASFHPEYRFDGSAQDDAANYSNRSPYPMLHILREDSLERAIANYPDIDKVPQKNIDRLEQIGYPAMKKTLADICNHTDEEQ